MSNSFSLSWNDVRFGGLKEVCEMVEAALAEAGVDFYYLIGAQARDLWYAAEKRAGAVTRDVDFAILVANAGQFDAVKEVLKKTHGFESSRENAFAMRSLDGTTVDILPFGGIEEDERAIRDGQGLTSIHVSGFKEVGAAGTAEVAFDEAQRFRLATLPAIVLLKLIAYDDRPEKRAKDADDISHIISSFYYLQSDLFFEKHHDVLEGIDEGHERMAARVIGRELRPILEESVALNERVHRILATHIERGAGGTFTMLMAQAIDKPRDEILRILEELRRGLDEGSPR